MAGRSSKLNKDTLAKICEYVKAGNTFKHSVQACGISEAAFYNWMKRGKDAQESGSKAKADQIYIELVESIKKAEAEAIVRNVAVINKAAQKTWQAAAWYLERRRPEEYGRREKHDVNHSGDLKLSALSSFADYFSERTDAT